MIHELTSRASAATLRRAAVALTMTIMLSGCTFYGMNNSDEATVAEISVAAEQIRQSYVRASAVFERLNNAAANDRSLDPAVERYSLVLADHGDLVNRLDMLDSSMGSGTDYRTAARTLRAISSEKSILDAGYAAVASSMAGSGPGSVPVTYARSTIVPPYYTQAARGGQRQVADVLRERNQ